MEMPLRRQIKFSDLAFFTCPALITSGQGFCLGGRVTKSRRANSFSSFGFSRRRHARVVVSSAAVGALLITGLAADPLNAQTAKAETLAPAGIPAAGPVSSVPDEFSARLAARLQGFRVEVAGDRTEAQRVYANPDGSLTVEAYGGPRWVRASDGSWQDLNLNLAAGAGGVVTPVAAAATIALSDGSGASPSLAASAGSGGSSFTGSSPLATVSVSGDPVQLGDAAAGVSSTDGWISGQAS